MTFSLLASVPHQGLGIVTATRTPEVGNIVPAVRPGVGAVASQAWSNPALRELMLDVLTRGGTPDDAIAAAQAADPEIARRQLGVIDARGRSAGFTGAETSAWAGEAAGAYCLAVGNLLVGEAVLPAMTDAFERSAGTLAERLLAGLLAGDAAGGDARGRQSAALLLVLPGGGVVDLRVDDHPDAPNELARRWHESRTADRPLGAV